MRRKITDRARVFCLATAVCALSSPTHAQMIPVTNASFENTTGQILFNEFSFGVPAGWQLYNPSGHVFGGYNVTGTLQNPEVANFDEPAPDGTRVLILFNRDFQGAGEYGMQQTLAATLAADTTYQLSVEVGNIGSGTAINGETFDLSGFPGYRVELLADLNPLTIGEEVTLAADLNSLVIAERRFATSTVLFDSSLRPDLVGEALAIRLVHLNLPLGLPGDPDSEVDFDAVRLEITPVPEPAGVLLAGAALATGLLFLRRRK